MFMNVAMSCLKNFRSLVFYDVPVYVGLPHRVHWKPDIWLERMHWPCTIVQVLCSTEWTFRVQYNWRNVLNIWPWKVVKTTSIILRTTVYCSQEDRTWKQRDCEWFQLTWCMIIETRFLPIIGLWKWHMIWCIIFLCCTVGVLLPCVGPRVGWICFWFLICCNWIIIFSFVNISNEKKNQWCNLQKNCVTYILYWY